MTDSVLLILYEKLDYLEQTHVSSYEPCSSICTMNQIQASVQNVKYLVFANLIFERTGKFVSKKLMIHFVTFDEKFQINIQGQKGVTSGMVTLIVLIYKHFC